MFGKKPTATVAGEHILAAYLFTQRGTSTTWLTRFFDIERPMVHTYISRVCQRAHDTRKRYQQAES